jgi:predicted AAA+ superfamily ATPase
LASSSITLLNGVRHVGKSVSVKELVKDSFKAEYISFDNITQMATASSALYEYLALRKTSLILGEAQLVPEVFRPLKIVVDRIRLNDKEYANGCFLLTGSADIMVLPKLVNPLVGGMLIIALYPLATCEIYSGKRNF